MSFGYNNNKEYVRNAIDIKHINYLSSLIISLLNIINDEIPDKKGYANEKLKEFVDVMSNDSKYIE